MPFCASCESIPLRGLGSRFASRPPSNQEDERVLHHTGGQLIASAPGCDFCHLVEAATLRLYELNPLPEPGRQCSPRELLAEQTGVIHVTPKADHIGKAFPHPGETGAFLTSLELRVESLLHGYALKHKIRLYLEGERENRLSSICDVPGRPELSNPGDEAAFALIRNWMESCDDQHPQCKVALAGYMVGGSSNNQMTRGKFCTGRPDRLLDVGHGKVRLRLTTGQTGDYAALSHCWGSPDRGPLKTTLDSLHAHLEDIPWDSLPRGFQDIVTVVRGIGLRWLWIDSLCIIQDDENDWIEQSRMMGLIYAHAHITIAPCHARDSWEGFLHRSTGEQTPAVHLPDFLGPAADPDAKVMAAARWHGREAVFPEHGILNTRAWATQEWLLSRRMVFFTPGAVIWSCQRITQRETGERSYNTSRDTNWKTIVERYSERSLTKPTDKLIALEGLRRELGVKLEYDYAFGIWKQNTPDQLLWQVCEQLSTVSESAANPLNLPSWTWASTSSAVRFLRVNKAKSLPRSIKFSADSKQLTITSWTTTITDEQWTSVDQLPSGPLTDLLRDDMQASNASKTSTMARILKLNDTVRQPGWIVLDREAVPQAPLLLVALMGPYLRRDEEQERTSGVIKHRKLREYWVIVLSESHVDFVYRRVGVGKVYGREWWQDAGVHEVSIV